MNTLPDSDNVKVFIRHRPTDGNTNKSSFQSPGPKNLIEQNADNLCTYYQYRNKFKETFSCDQYFDPSARQDELYDMVARPIVTNTLLGYSGTIFAYGAANSGKTYTMRGENKNSTKGIIPRCLEQILIEKGPDCEVWVSYIQNYCETITDLLSGQQKLTLQNDPINRDYAEIKDLSAVCITKTEDIEFILNKKKQTIANIKRRLKSQSKYLPNTDGHCILTIRIIDNKRQTLSENAVTSTPVEQFPTHSYSRFKPPVTPEPAMAILHRTSTLCLVDMAGMTRSASTSYRLEEVKAIHQSLAAFGDCLNAMVEKKPHIPYRSSIFTRLMQRYMDQRNLMSLIIHVAPQLDSKSESLTTLRVGSKALQIEVYPALATHISSSLSESVVSNTMIGIHPNNLEAPENSNQLERSFSRDESKNRMSSKEQIGYFTPDTPEHTKNSFTNDSPEPNDGSTQELEKILKSMQIEYSIVVAELNSKENELNEYRQEIVRLQNEPNIAESEYSEMMTALSVREKYIVEKLGQNNACITEQNEIIHDLEMKLKSLRAEYSIVVAKLSNKEKEVNECRQEIDSLRNASEYSDMMAALSAREKYIMEMLGQSNTSSAEQSELTQELEKNLKSLQTEYSIVVTKLSNKEKEVNECRQEINRLQNQSKVSTDSVQQTADELIQDLQSKLNSLQTDYSNVVAKLNSKENEIIEYRREIEELRSELNALKTESQKFIDKQIGFLETIHTDLEATTPDKSLVQYQQSNQELKSQIEALNIKLQEERNRTLEGKKMLDNSVSYINTLNKQLERERKDRLKEKQNTKPENNTSKVLSRAISTQKSASGDAKYKEIKDNELSEQNKKLQSQLDILNNQLDEERKKTIDNEKILRETISQLEISKSQLELEQIDLMKQIEGYMFQLQNNEPKVSSHSNEYLEIMQSQLISCMSGFDEIRYKLFKEMFSKYSNKFNGQIYPTRVPSFKQKQNIIPMNNAIDHLAVPLPVPLGDKKDESIEYLRNNNTSNSTPIRGISMRTQNSSPVGYTYNSPLISSSYIPPNSSNTDPVNSKVSSTSSKTNYLRK